MDVALAAAGGILKRNSRKAEDNPDYLLCGKTTAEGTCSDISKTRKQPHIWITRPSEDAARSVDTMVRYGKYLKCPLYYVPAKDCDKSGNCVTGGKGETYRTSQYGVVNAKNVNSDFDGRYMRLCKRQQFEPDDNANILKCCQGEWADERDNLQTMGNKPVDDVFDTYNVKARSKCPYQYKQGSTGCDTVLMNHCLQHDNMKSTSCEKWFNNATHSVERLAMRDNAMREYCKANPDAIDCSCFKPKGFNTDIGIPNKPECYHKQCTQDGYMTEDMKESSYHCPSIMICKQAMTTADSDHLVMNNITVRQDCASYTGVPVTQSLEVEPPESTPIASTPFNPDNPELGASSHTSSNPLSDTSQTVSHLGESGSSTTAAQHTNEKITANMLLMILVFILFVILAIVVAKRKKHTLIMHHADAPSYNKGLIH